MCTTSDAARPGWALAAGLALLAFAAPGHAEGLPEAERAALARALGCVNLSIDDLGWDKRPIDDPFRLAVVNRALDEPLSLAELALRARQDFAADPAASATSASYWLDAAATTPPAADVPPPTAGGSERARFEQQAPPALVRLERARAAALASLAAALPADAAAVASLKKDAARLYLDESEEQWDSAQVRAAAALVRTSSLVRAFEALAGEVAPARGLGSMAATRARTWTLVDEATGETVTVALGSDGPDRHEADVVLDPGGDDVYEGSQFIVDLAGNDTYRDCASGLHDAGLLVDLAGDDRHLGKNVSQGAAVVGVSLLVDVAGSDAYEAAEVSQGAGVLGIGMLFDLAGNDSYRGARFVQGFAGVSGLGVLSDVAGNDVYWAGGTFKHEPLLPENYQSLSQGFGFGLRPDASGGVGILADHAGNDLYHAEVYGQGASYWFALGILVDTEGHDKYDLFQYGQGAGIHLSAGVLLDGKGSDAYSCNNGVAQGSGHDWAVGLLWDQAGNDAYQGSGMSQGGANANGIGMLLDSAGNDSYAGWNERNQGDSFPARGSVGLGVLLDMEGRDKYTHGGSDGATWTRGNVGVGHDVPEPPKAEVKP